MQTNTPVHTLHDAKIQKNIHLAEITLLCQRHQEENILTIRDFPQKKLYFCSVKTNSKSACYSLEIDNQWEFGIAVGLTLRLTYRF